MGRGNAASRLQQAVNRRLTLVKRASNSKNRLARLVPSPKLLAQYSCDFRGTSHTEHLLVKINRGVSPTH